MMNSGSFISVMFQRPPSILDPFSMSNLLFTPPPPSRCTLLNMPITTLLTPTQPPTPLKLSKGRSVTLKCVVVQETLKTFSE